MMNLAQVSTRGLLLAATAFCCAALASDFNVTPVRVDLSSAHGTAALTVENDSTEPVVIQSEVLAWSQENGENSYIPTKEILATPPIFTVPPGGRQIVRMGMRRDVDPKIELAYRVFLTEVPGPPKPEFQGVQLRLRLGVPVYVAPKTAAAPQLKWRAVQEPDGQIRLTLGNEGNAHIQITDFTLLSPGDENPLAKQGAPFTLLAEQSQSWTLKPDPKVQINEGRLHLQAYSTLGRLDVELLLEKP